MFDLKCVGGGRRQGPSQTAKEHPRAVLAFGLAAQVRQDRLKGLTPPHGASPWRCSTETETASSHLGP